MTGPDRAAQVRAYPVAEVALRLGLGVLEGRQRQTKARSAAR